MRRRLIRVSAFLLVAVMMASLIMPMSQSAARDGSIELTIHYHRYDGAYEGWNLWIWPKDGDGAAYNFDGTDDFGQTFTMTIDSTWPELAGIIVRMNEWEAKDIDVDRYINLEAAKDGKLDIYVVQDDPILYYDISETDLSPKFIKASITQAGTIIFNTTEAIDTSGEGWINEYSVVDETGAEYAITDIELSANGTGTSAIIKLEATMSAEHSYILKHKEFGDIAISMNGLYSTAEFEEAYTYTGNDLGATYTKEATSFRLWAPTADSVSVLLYSEGQGKLPEDGLINIYDMTKDVNGTWILKLDGDMNGVYYNYGVQFGDIINIAVDPYARTTGANGQKAMIIDLDATDPEGWQSDVSPELVSITDAVLYELHVRDLSADAASGIKNVGKYLAFTETGTKNSSGLSTGIDHIKELGVTHIHLLPVYDYASVDETAEKPAFNWGYDPQNYNVPEGSYSTDPYHGEVRVKEFKQMVQSLHSNGLRVVMDVVYNHTFSTDGSPFNMTVPQYYYRMNGDTYSNGSGCGNEVASERSMVRKYIVDSVVYWATEYHIDGFRFDLMGLLDIETMNQVRAALNQVDPDIIIYGEGWTGGSSALPNEESALKAQAYMLDSGIAVFSDDMRDGLKGSVFANTEKGFVSGADGRTERIKFGIVAATDYKDIIYALVGSSLKYWAGAPTQCINYAACHDNNTLWDRLCLSNTTDTVSVKKKMNKLTSAIVLTSQGIPLLLSGEEILRSKVDPNSTTGFSDNSYKSSDAVNSIKWDEKTGNIAIFDYYKGLIALRKAHPAFRMTTSAEVNEKLKFIETEQENLIAYTISGNANGETSDCIYVAFNAEKEAATLELPAGEWDMYVNGETAGTEIIETISGSVTVDGISAVVLVREQAPAEVDSKEENKQEANTTAAPTAEAENEATDAPLQEAQDEAAAQAEPGNTDDSKSNTPIIIVLAICVVGGIAAGYYFMAHKRR